MKLINTDSVRNDGVPDGRVWEEGRGLPLQPKAPTTDDSTLSSGKALLPHAEKSADGYYVVDSTPPRRR